jgi:hypothetical protein
MATLRIVMLFLSLLAGCATVAPANGAFRVAGSLPAAAGVCDLLLMAAGSDTPLNTAKVSGNFEQGFVVATDPADYRVSIVCAKKAPKVITVRYGVDIKPGQVAFLGDIAL